MTNDVRFAKAKSTLTETQVALFDKAIALYDHEDPNPADYVVYVDYAREVTKDNVKLAEELVASWETVNAILSLYRIRFGNNERVRAAMLQMFYEGLDPEDAGCLASFAALQWSIEKEGETANHLAA